MWAYEDEIVVHDIESFDAITTVYKRLLGISGMHQYDIDISFPSQAKRLSGTDGDGLDLDVGVFRKFGQ